MHLEYIFDRSTARCGVYIEIRNIRIFLRDLLGPKIIYEVELDVPICFSMLIL